MNQSLHRFLIFICIAFIYLYLPACNKKPDNPNRPLNPWAFRSNLDWQTRILTIALDTECYVAYDLANCVLYKAWKGGVTMEGAAFTNKKNVQPTTWGTSYFSDSLRPFKWNVEINGKKDSFKIVNKGYAFRDNHIFIKILLITSSKDSIRIEERPEFIRNESGSPALERIFETSGIPGGTTISLVSKDIKLTLKAHSTSRFVSDFKSLPAQYPPTQQEEYDHRGRYYMEKSDCFTCHELDKNTVGPSLHHIAQRYQNDKTIVDQLIGKVKTGGTGIWGTSAMNPHPGLNQTEIKTMLDYILSLKPKENIAKDPEPEDTEPKVKKSMKAGYGAPLEGLHPSYNVQTIHNQNFQPRVGGIAFLPDGRLLVTTWDVVGGVYLLDGIQSGDTNKITYKRIASGLAEPLGITVVNGEIYVLQKPELTKLIDHDGDDIIDEYEAVCNTWGMTSDFHEFAFGLLYKDGYFYANLSLAMRLMSGEKQQPDRGKTIRISPDGNFEWITYGLRQPNGIGFGVDDEIFVCENQGEWIPANKLIHVKKGEYHGMPWGILPDTSSKQPVTARPAIWLPENEIANSPSQPILMRDGPYKGQMLHGDVTHGGIKRDFLEKINGDYQGAVFRFTQGLEAGVNRLCWGPDGALYIGGIGMVGGWSWKEKQYGLQRMKYNGNTTFEMLAIRAKPHGFEIEFTEPLKQGQQIKSSDFLIQQWWYLPTSDYGGPKKDLERLKITISKLSEDRTRLYLEMPDLKKEHVVYFRLPEYLNSSSGQLLWSSEAWYTLNNIPG